MKTITDHLANYAAYHRNKKNIATHLIGIPLIVVAIEILLSRPVWLLGDIPMSPAIAVSLVAVVFYLFLDLFLGVIMTLLLLLAVCFGSQVAQMSTTIWLSLGVGLFVIGWIFQFIGHYFEGKKPAFVDDLMGLAIGPLFVVAEVVFAIGLKKDLHQAVEARFKE